MTTSDPSTTVDRPATHRRSSISLAQAARTFATRPQPWLLAAAVTIAVTARVLSGGYAWSDVYLVVGYLAAWPVVEWVVHTSLLHWKPRVVAGRTIDPLVARKHREHHVDPQQLDLIFIPVPALLTVAVGVAALVWVLPTRIGLTLAVVVTTVGLIYEWLHYLVHTDYRPRSAPYRALWRHHRLHHYKNENYWFTVTTASTADRVLRTQPDPSEVPSSPTARDLLGTGGR